jgi:hypothetical protein
MPDLHIAPHERLHPNGLWTDQEFSQRKPRLRYRTWPLKRTWRERLFMALYGRVGIVVVLALIALSALAAIWFLAIVFAWIRHLMSTP